MGTHQHEYTAGNLTMNSLKKLKPLYSECPMSQEFLTSSP